MALLGEPGVGKSALLSGAASLARARGLRVLAASGFEAEGHVPFGTLQQILHPILHHAHDIDARHRSVLLNAVGLVEVPDTSNPLLVALGALETCGRASQSRPILVLIDDLQWVDSASLDVLRFMARRLDAERIVMLVATRYDHRGTRPHLAIERLEIEGLDRASSGTLLDRAHPGLTKEDRTRVLRLAVGNPLALLELPSALASVSPRSGRWANDEAPLTSRLERAFAQRLDGLDPPTRVLALVAALQGSTTVRETALVTHQLLGRPIDSAAFDPLVAAGLLTVDGVRFEFRHPLVRSGIVHRAAVSERRQVHEALASACTDRPDEATWHRSMAASSEDETIAAALEEGADRAIARGAALLAGEWLERAAFLSPGAGARAHRLLRAAEVAFELGQATTVRRLTSAAAAVPLAPTDEARLVGIEAAFDDGVPGGPEHVRRLTAAASRAHEGGDDELAVRLLVGAAKSAYWQAADVDVTDWIRHVIDDLDIAGSHPALIFIRSLVDPFVHGAYIIDHLAVYSQMEITDPAAAGALSNAGFCAGDFAQALYFARRASDALREQARLSLLTQTLVLETFSSLYLGRWDITTIASAEAYRLGLETDQPVWTACALLGQGNIAAVRGDADAAHDAAASVEQTAILTGNRALLNGAVLVRGHAALSTRSPLLAYTELRRMTDPDDEAYQSPQCVWVADLLADAAVQAGQVDEGRGILGRLESLVADTPAPGIRRIMALARAILADEATAEMCFHEASKLGISAAPWYRGRVDLAYGSWLRRHRRPAESRDRLRSAQLVFDALGAHGWSQRASEELVASGDRVTRNAPDGWSRLTGQELQIAQLAAQGLSNREIGSRLFLSHRTVGSHLYRIFPKLGVRSRAQLHAALGTDGRGVA